MPTLTDTANFKALSNGSTVDGSFKVGLFNFSTDDTGTGLADFTVRNSGSGTCDVTTNAGSLTIIPTTTTSTRSAMLAAEVNGYSSGDNFDVSCKYDCASLTSDGYGGGILLLASDSGYVELIRRNNGGSQIVALLQVGGSGSSVTATVTATSMYMRLVKSGTLFTAYYKINAGDAWTTLGTVTYAGGGALRFFGRSTVTSRFDDVSFASGFAAAATVQVKGTSTLYLDAGSGLSFDWSEWTKTLTSGTTCRARYYWSDNSGATPSYGSWLSWADFIAQTNTSSDKRYIWLQLELTYSSGQASLDDISYSVFALDTTPPDAPSSTETSTPQGRAYTLANWTQPTSTYFDHCEVRRTKLGSHEYLYNVDGLPTWQSTGTTPWKIREGTGGAGISPASYFLDESITSVTAYAVRSVDEFGNASAWTACTVVTPEYCDTSDVRSGVDRGDGNTGTLAVPATNKVLTGEAVDATTGTLTLPAVGNVLSGIPYGVGGNGSTGTFDEASRNTDPGVANVLSGTGYKIANVSKTGTYLPDFPAVSNVLNTDTVNNTPGTLTLPGTGDVRDGVSYGVGGSGSTGTYDPMAEAVFPPVADVLPASGTYGPTGDEYTGTLAPDYPDPANVLITDTTNGQPGTFDSEAWEASRNTDPGAANVALTVDYLIYGESYTGTLVPGSVGAVFPAPGNVLSRSEKYGPTGVEYEGNATLPAVKKVLTTESFGAEGTEFTGSYKSPSIRDVRSGVKFGGE